MIPIIGFSVVSVPATGLSNLWAGAFPWEAVAVLAVLITFAFSAIALMFARLFSSKEIEKFAKVEFMYALSSVVLIAFMIFFVDIMALKATAFVVSMSRDRSALMPIVENNPSPFTVAEFYLNRTGVCAQTRYMEAFCLSVPFKAVGSMEMDETETAKGLENVPNGLSSVSRTATGVVSQNIIGVVNNFAAGTIFNLMYINYLVYLQKHILLFAQQTMLLIFLPLGVVLRAFPMVRGTGNLLISVAMGLYFVYPVSYSILLVLSRSSNNFDTSCGISGITQIDSSGSLPCADLLTDFSRIKGAIGSYFVNTEEGANPAMAALTDMQRLISDMVIYAVVYPFVVAVITYTFIKSFATFLNVEAQEFAQGLVRLL